MHCGRTAGIDRFLPVPMNPSDDPFALLPFAIAGLVVGLALAGGCGYGLYQGRVDRSGDRWSQHVIRSGAIEWAGWRQSAAGGGPDWYLQVRLAGEDRGFLVGAAEVSAQRRTRYGFAEADGARRSISGLIGKTARLAVDSSLVADSSNRTPYLSALAVAGETVVPLRAETTDAPRWWRLVVQGLFALGVLAGIGLFTSSAQHFVVCLRHRTHASEG